MEKNLLQKKVQNKLRKIKLKNDLYNPIFKYEYEKRNKDDVKMELKEYIKNNEKVFNGKRDIKYLFQEGKNSDKLIVTFPGFSSPGRPPEYNYIRTLMGCNAHKLYILDDYGPRGSYLIGGHCQKLGGF